VFQKFPKRIFGAFDCISALNGFDLAWISFETHEIPVSSDPMHGSFAAGIPNPAN
jgi:hypothetical protein